MEETPPNDDKKGRWFWNRQLPLERETCVFILVNALDVFMTFLLLRTNQFNTGSYAVETNQIANYFLASWGMKGMVYFKFGLVAVVTVIAQIVVRKKPRTARYLLNIGSLVVAIVVIYSFMLYVRAGHLGRLF